MSALPKPVSLDEFLDWEDRQELKWEFDGFAAQAMTGGTSAHALIQARLLGLLFARLEGTNCRAYGSELKLRTSTSIRYPDALIVCARLDARATFTTDAAVVFEILGKSSAVHDLGAKTVEYGALPSLQRYIVLHQSVAAAETFFRDGEGWAHRFVGADGALDLGDLGSPLPLAELHDGVEFAE